MFYPHISFSAALSGGSNGNFKINTRINTTNYEDGQYWNFKNGHLSESGKGLYSASFERNYYDDDGYLIRNTSGDANNVATSTYERDGSYSKYFSQQSNISHSLSVNIDGSGIETWTDTYESPPEIRTQVYAPGTFSVTPQTPHAAVFNTATYQLDSSSRIVKMNLPEDDGGFLDVRYDYSGAKAAERHLLSDANGKLVEETRYDSNGHLYFELDFNSDGSRTTTHYKSGSYIPSSDNTIFEDGSSIAHEYGPGGKVTSTTNVSVDGTKTKIFDKPDGLYTNTYKDGALALTEILKSNGSKTAVAFQKGITVADTDANDLFTSFGQDTFVFSGGGNDTIRNFHATGELSDVIKLIGINPEHVSLSMQGQNTVIDVGDDASITLVGAKFADVIDNILFA